MTNHKCGTCHFYEVGAQQTHGWCRNPAYPRRDDVALLRNDELACRSGWGKDFWEARRTGASIAASTTPLIDETTEPIPVPIGTGIARHQAPAATGIPLRQDGAHGAPHIASAAARSLAIAPKDGTMGTIKTSPPLSGHPELNELGVPIRSPKRSSVAEAHRRAMERRAQERQAKEERDRLAAQLALKQADAAREQHAQVKITEPTPERRPSSGELQDFSTPSLESNTAPVANAPKGERTEPKRELTRAESGGPKRELARPEITAPTMPRPREAELPVTTTSRHEAEDVIISTGEKIKESIVAPTITTAFTADPAGPQQSTVGFRSVETPPESETAVPPVPTTVNTPTPEPVAPTKEARSTPYWDQSGALKGFGRLRRETTQTDTPDRATDSQSVRRVGRQASVEPKPTSTRAIKSLGASMNGAPAVEEEREIAPPVRQAKPIEVKQAIIAPPSPPAEPAPRQIDESLLRQLENDWQAQQLAAHAGQRCGTCRFFQSTEMGRGLCNCPFAPVHRQQTEAEGLPCATALGVWWAAPDEGWLERAERRPRRATPLLDAFLREHEAMEPLRTTSPLRRGAR